MGAFAGSLDANVLLRLLLNDVPDQHEAVMRLLGSARGQFMVADAAFVEVVFVLGRAYGRSREQINREVRQVMNLQILNCNRVMLDMALDEYENRSALSFEDCCLAAYAALNDAKPLYTFDRKLANQLSQVELVT